MTIVTAGYALFAVYGLVVFLEQILLPYVPYATLELFEHGVAVLILGGLLAFFLALTSEE